MVALGALACLMVALRYGRREGINDESILDLFMYVVISATVGARLFYVFAFPRQYWNDPISVFYVSQGGLVFIGGLCGVLISVLIFVKRHDVNVWKLLDVLSPGTMIGYSIGRIGCLLNGCCYGITLFGVQQPTQIYSSLSGLLIFFLLIYLYDRKKYDGQIFIFALFYYSIYRFLLEFVRYNPVHIYIFTPNQLLAALMFIISACILWKKRTI
jgi:phosphatidylglycerol---prolipoprotein diacylglyceryl transferase